jgi:hypothetical protein
MSRRLQSAPEVAVRMRLAIQGLVASHAPDGLQ